jgi:hypothetical protein
MIMTAKDIGDKIQGGFDWVRDVLRPVENRWLIFLVSVFVLLLARGLGAHGLGTIIALVYIMYFVTLGRDRRDL